MIEKDDEPPILTMPAWSRFSWGSSIGRLLGLFSGLDGGGLLQQEGMNEALALALISAP